jgi:hypothetical protein
VVGVVEAVSGNIPILLSGGRHRDRFYVRVIDCVARTTTIAVLGARGPVGRTSLGGCAAAIEASRLRTGQVAVFGGVKAGGGCGTDDDGGAAFVADAEHGATVRCPSSLGAGLHLVTHPPVNSMMPLCQNDADVSGGGGSSNSNESKELDCVYLADFVRAQHVGRITARACVTDVRPLPPSRSFVGTAHADCRWPAMQSGGRWDCVFCRLCGVVVEPAYRLVLVLDDGTACVAAEASAHAVATLLPVSVSDFAALPPAEQAFVLDKLKCRDVAVDVCAFMTDVGELHLRVDAIAHINPARTCREHHPLHG